MENISQTPDVIVCSVMLWVEIVTIEVDQKCIEQNLYMFAKQQNSYAMRETYKTACISFKTKLVLFRTFRPR